MRTAVLSLIKSVELPAEGAHHLSFRTDLFHTTTSIRIAILALNDKVHVCDFNVQTRA